MPSHPLPKDRSLSKLVAKFPAIDALSRSLLLNKFKDLKFGELQIHDRTGPTVSELIFGESHTGLVVRLTIFKSSFYSRTLFGGSIGNAESYIDGDWETDN